jgi:hypothetical protein
VTHEPNRGWVRDHLKVRHVQIPDAPGVFFLVGLSESEEICALIGSMNHMLGGGPAEFAKPSASFFPAFAHYIGEAQEHATSTILTADLLGLRRMLNTGNSDGEIASILYGFYRQASGYEFRIEFLARSVFRGKNSLGTVVNALTPLWVTIE